MCTIAFGQSKTDSTKLTLEQVEVIKAFEVNLAQSKMITVIPKSPESTNFNPKYKYEINLIPVEIKYPEPEIRPLSMDPDEPFIIKNGYVFGSYGLRNNPTVKAGYNIAKKDSYHVGFDMNFDALDNSNKVLLQKYSNFGVDLHGNYLIKENVQLHGGINVGNKTRYLNHYAIDSILLIDANEARRKINNLDLSFGVSNPEPTKYSINYFAEIGLKRFTLTNSNAKENGLNISGNVQKLFGSGSQLFLQAKVDYNALTTDTSVSLLQAQVIPQFKTKFKNIIVNIGVNYINGGKNNSFFYPELQLSYGIKGQKVLLFAGTTQELFINNLRNLALQNPYVGNNLSSISNNVSQQIFAGIKGQFSYLQYNIRAGLKKIDNQAFYINNRNDIRYFDLVYDALNSVFISANLDLFITNQLSVGGRFTQNFFDKNILTHLWHTANVEAFAYIQYKLLQDKLSIKGELFFNDKLEYLDSNNNIQKTNILFDLNATASYSITDHFIVEAKAINLFDNKFQRWYGYPSIGINGSLGVKWFF